MAVPKSKRSKANCKKRRSTQLLKTLYVHSHTLPVLKNLNILKRKPLDTKPSYLTFFFRPSVFERLNDGIKYYKKNTWPKSF